MKNTTILAGVLVLACNYGLANEKPREKQPIVDVAFVLDTTGSMGGLIAGAKKKIWSIANQVVLGTPKPKVRMGLVGYRDKGDAYVTKVFNLTDNIDEIYEKLMAFNAGGGGDGPENVNQALHDAINKLNWTDLGHREGAVKIIYLVGDYPPHNEYKDVPTYDKLAKSAIEKGIYINTVLCGTNGQARKVWQEIASAAEGRFVAIAQDGGVRDIATPYDAELAKQNAALVKTVVVYGSAEEQTAARKLNSAAYAMGAKPEAAPVAADRASFAARSGRAGSADLVQAIEEKKVKLADLEKDDLPEEMKTMSAAERKAYLAEQQAKRKKIQAQIKALSKKRAAYIRKELEKGGGKRDGFDEQVVETLRAQAEKAGIEYK